MRGAGLGAHGEGELHRDLQVAGTPYTATGRALTTRTMGFNVAPELFGELKSSQQLTVSANQKRYTISLDGIEAALQRTRDCVKQYAAARPGRAATIHAARGRGQRAVRRSRAC